LRARLAWGWSDWFAWGAWWLSGGTWKAGSTRLAVLSGLAGWTRWARRAWQAAAFTLRASCGVDDRGRAVALSLTTGAVVGALRDRLEVVHF